DPRSFPKRGPPSVGVKRPWGGHRGQGDHCQGSVFRGYVSPHAPAWLDFRLSLAAAWARDEQRRHACHVPPAGRYQTRHEPGVERLAAWREQGPHGWGTGDDALGRHTRLRHDWRARGERYGLGGPCTPTMRDLEA